MMIDVVSILLLAFFFVRGYRRGVIIAIFSVVALLLGIILALKLSASLATWLLTKGWVSAAWTQPLSYLILFLGAVFLVRLMAKLLESVTKSVGVNWLNGLVGGLLYAFLAAVVWSSLLWVGNQMHLISPETKTYSKTYRHLEPVAPLVFAYCGKLLPMARDVFGDLHLFFQQVDTTLPDHVGFNR